MRWEMGDDDDLDALLQGACERPPSLCALSQKGTTTLLIQYGGGGSCASTVSSWANGAPSSPQAPWTTLTRPSWCPSSQVGLQPHASMRRVFADTCWVPAPPAAPC